jgi:TPR repeat protein
VANSVAKDLTKMAQLLREAAENDNADAAYDLAVSYEKGMGVRKSEKSAAKLYLKAGLLDDRQSIYHVGRCYQLGLGVRRDRSIDSIWYDRAAKLGFKR